MSQFKKLSSEEQAHWREAINYGLEKVHSNGWDKRNNSTKFDLIYKNKLLPPKQIIASAFEYLDKHKLETVIKRIPGGDEETNSFLKDFGLEIVMKKRKLKYYIDKINVWHDWKSRYENFVPKFINEASKGNDWQFWEEGVFTEYFERSYGQCVSSLKQGYFTNDEKKKIKDSWNELAPLIKAIALQQYSPSFENYELLKNGIRKFTQQDRRAATYRLIAALQPNSLCTIVNHKNLNELIGFLNGNVENVNLKYSGNWFESSNAVLNFFKNESGFTDPYELVTYPWQLLEYFKGNHHTKEDNDMSEDNIDFIYKKELELLKYKKQIILQGPPGTGKTRLAKKLAAELIRFDTGQNTKPQLSIEINDIKNHLSVGQVIKSATDYTEYTIIEIGDTNITVKLKNTGSEYKAPYKEIIFAYKTKMWDGKQKNGTHPYSAAIAKYIFFKNKITTNISEVSNQYNLIQFHPSYTYEDFVRGIVAKPNPDGEGILFEAENKTLGEFAKDALLNYQLCKKNVNITVTDIELFNLFINDIKEKIADSEEQRYPITEAVYLFEPDEKRFKYKGDNWIAHSKGLNMKFSELEKIIGAGITERSQVKQLQDLEELTKQHASYFIKVVELFYNFKSNYSGSTLNNNEKVNLKNYVLIIDEINRANLSSVLGELIYALEYRGEEVESMYKVDGSNKLVLPPNLYIIGSMNTADRSVGHIDYAIRRRFAFVDVLPQDLSSELGDDFKSNCFNKVAELFTEEYLSPEFDSKDVQLGHSYFIQQYEKDENDKEIKGKPCDFNMRVKYEIVPILKEYVKDGILNIKAYSFIDQLEKEYS